MQKLNINNKKQIDNKKSEESKVINKPNFKESKTLNNTTLIINDSEESDSLQSHSSSQHSENYEAEDENEGEIKIKHQKTNLCNNEDMAATTASTSQTQQQLQQVQRFLKSFDSTSTTSNNSSNNMDTEKSGNIVNELRNFRQAPKHHHSHHHLTKTGGKFNISTKFLRKSRNKMKTLINDNLETNHKEYQNLSNNCSSSSSSASAGSNSNNNNLIINNNIINNNNTNDESIAKLKDFSIDSLLNH